LKAKRGRTKKQEVKKMKRKLISVGISIVVFVALFGLIVPVQAPGESFTIGVKVFDTDGTTPVDGVIVNVTNLETGSSLNPVVTVGGGLCIVNLANLHPNPAHSEGDDIQIVADAGPCKMNTTVVPRAATSPQFVELILQAEDTAPTITDLQPADGSCVTDSTPEICANYSDATGINTSSVTMKVDGAPVPATVTETGVCYTPPTGLTEGEHTVMVNVSDICGNQNSTSWSFTVDTIAPTIEFIEPPTPANNTEITVNYANVSVNVTDYGCGIDNVTVVLTWDGTAYQMVEYMFAFTEGKYFLNMTDLSNGEYAYWVQANDTAGNMRVSETRIVKVNVTAMEYRFTLQFVTGYNLISIPVSDTSVTNASSLATKIGTNCTEVVRWNSTLQQLVSHIAGWPLNDFVVTGGEGYFVNVNNPTIVEFTGMGWQSPFDMSLVTGYTIIGMPVNDTSVINASSLATKIGDNCTEVVKWNSTTQQLVSHIAGWPLNDFVVTGGEGYYVNVVNPTDVTFEGEPWQD